MIPVPVHRLGALAVLGFALATTALSYQLSLGSLARPGPGLWPFLAGAGMTACALVLLVRDPASDYEEWTQASTKIALALACVAGFIVVFQAAGLILPAVALLMVWLRFFAGETWPTTTALAVAIPLGLYLLFDLALGVPFPPDLLGDPLRELL